MIAKKLALKAATTVVTAVVLAMALVGCGSSNEGDTSALIESYAGTAYGVYPLPAAQGLLEFSPSRALSVLENFEYREHEGEGQWANSPSVFDVYDNGSQATADSALEPDEVGWIMLLADFKSGKWRNCTLKALESGADLEQATIIVYPQEALSFDGVLSAAEFINAMYSCARGVTAIDADGSIAYAVVKNTTGAVCQIIQNSPGMFTLTIHPQSHWEDASYDELVDECKKIAEANGCEYGEFLKSVPLFEDPRMVLAE